MSWVREQRENMSSVRVKENQGWGNTNALMHNLYHGPYCPSIKSSLVKVWGFEVHLLQALFQCSIHLLHSFRLWLMWAAATGLMPRQMGLLGFGDGLLLHCWVPHERVTPEKHTPAQIIPLWVSAALDLHSLYGWQDHKFLWIHSHCQGYQKHFGMLC